MVTGGFPISTQSSTPPSKPRLAIGCRKTKGHTASQFFFTRIFFPRSRLGMSAEILINPAKWRLCASVPAISRLAHPPKSDAAVAAGPCARHDTPAPCSSPLPRAQHYARMSTSIKIHTKGIKNRGRERKPPRADAFGVSTFAGERRHYRAVCAV